MSDERVWRKGGYFSDIRPELNVEKKEIPETTLFFVNQSYLKTVKNGDIAVYNHNFIIGEIIIAGNQSNDVKLCL